MTNLECVILIYQTMLRGAEDARFTLGKSLLQSLLQNQSQSLFTKVSAILFLLKGF